MGLLADLRHKHQTEMIAARQQAWEVERAELQTELQVATTFQGLDDGEGLQLRAGERLYFPLGVAPLLEIARTQGHRTGVYGGPSFRVAKGVYMRTGAFRSHYVPGVEQLAQIDVGSVYVTDQRVVFMGGNQTREFDFAKLVGYEHHPEGAYPRFSVANRQRSSCIGYGSQETAWCFRLDLAHAQFSGQRDAYVASIQQELDQHVADRPAN
ncbi:MAG: hypothetical protein ACYDC5_05370 [Candidatus Dormibacteria bacterium]